MTQYESLQFDGLSVDHFAGSFAGAFDLDENYEIDSEVSFIVVAKVTGAQVQTTKLGDLKRINKMEVLEVSVTGSGSTRRNRSAAAQIAGQLTLDADDETFEEEFLRTQNGVSVVTPAAPAGGAEEDDDEEEVFSPHAPQLRPKSVRDKALAKFLDGDS